MKDKFILDACCGARMMWLNKRHPNAIYIDERSGVFMGKKVRPDIVMDNRDLKFPDKSFKIVVADPPHIVQRKSDKAHIIAQFGCLSPETWQNDLKRMVNECWRVLDDYGIFVFKWNDCNKSFNDILMLLPIKPLFYNKINAASKGGSNTFWAVFMKIP